MSRLICNDFDAISIQPKAFILQNVVGFVKKFLSANKIISNRLF